MLEILIAAQFSKRAAQLSLPAGAPIPPDSKLPYDAILYLTLRRP